MCHVSILQKRFVFATGCPDCIHYVSDTDRCIDHLQHTEAKDNVEEMDAFGEDGALLIIVVMQMQTFRDDFLGEHRLIIECSVPAACIFNGGCGCVSLEDALLRL